MADIFISYASEDRPRVEPIAKALEEHGWSVWWDRTIPPGKSFDEAIEEAITAAKCVVVLWSDKSKIRIGLKRKQPSANGVKSLCPPELTLLNLPWVLG
jgi:hypothetical protein